MLPSRSHLRGPRRGWRHGAGPAPDRARAVARPQDDHHPGPHRVSNSQGKAGAADRDDEAAHRLRRVQRDCVRHDGRQSRAAGPGHGIGERRLPRARPRALRVPHRRRLPLTPVRLRASARESAGDHPVRGARSVRLHAAGGARHRAPQQDAPRSASTPISATTASEPRSWSTSGSRTSGS